MFHSPSTANTSELQPALCEISWAQHIVYCRGDATAFISCRTNVRSGLRVRDKNLRAGETTPVHHPNNAAVGSYGVPSPPKQRQEALGGRASRGKSVAWQSQHQQQRHICDNLGEGTLRRRGNGGGSSSTHGYERETGRGGSFTGGAGLEVEGSGEGDRKRVLLILRKLEDHGRVSESYIAIRLVLGGKDGDKIWYTATDITYTIGTLRVQLN